MNTTTHATSLMKFPPEYSEQLELIGQIVGRALVEAGVGIEFQAANDLAYKVVEALRREIGGGQMYLPRGHRLNLSIREQQIWRDFNGSNVQELAAKYQLSHVQIRNIIARARERDVADRQRDIFAQPQSGSGAFC